MVIQQNKSVARLENDLVFNYQYAFSAKEQKTMLFLIANLEKESDSVMVSIKDIESILKDDGKKWGASYKDIRELCFSLLDKKFFHKSKVKYKGTTMEAGYNWFQSVVPVADNEGTALKFRFSQDALPFLLELKEYVQINLKEIKHMKSGYSIRLFQLLKAKRNKSKEYNVFTEVAFEVEELKSMLGVNDKYPRFNNFRQKVLDVAQQEINGRTCLYFDMSYRYGNSREKKIDKIIFKIFDSEKEANAHTQLRINFEPKKEINPFQDKIFELNEFKKRFSKIYGSIKEKINEQYKELNDGKQINNLGSMVDDSIYKMSEYYFDNFISQTVKEPTKITNAIETFEKLGIPVKTK
jgi:plasmid replication initiation protein